MAQSECVTDCQWPCGVEPTKRPPTFSNSDSRGCLEKSRTRWPQAGPRCQFIQNWLESNQGAHVEPQNENGTGNGWNLQEGPWASVALALGSDYVQSDYTVSRYYGLDCRLPIMFSSQATRRWAVDSRLGLPRVRVGGLSVSALESRPTSGGPQRAPPAVGVNNSRVGWLGSLAAATKGAPGTDSEALLDGSSIFLRH